MDVFTYFKWDSKASKTTVIFPGLALAITVAFFFLYIFYDSSVSQPIFDAVKPLTMSIIIAVLDIILILGMLYFQPSKTPAAVKKVEDKKTVVVSGESNEAEPESAAPEKEVVKQEDKKVEVSTVEEKEDKQLLEKGLGDELMDQPELEAAPEEVDIEEVEVPKPTAMVKDILTFPEIVGGGIYADTYINAGNGTTLKLRQEVVEEIYLIS